MAEIRTLTCPSCGGRTRITANARRYACEYCGNEVVVPPEAGQPPAALPPVRAPIPQPGSVLVEDAGQTLRIVRRWFSAKYIGLGIFCLAWDSFLVFWYSMAFGTNAPWIMICFPVAHVAVGVGLTYTVLAGLLNHTTLKITPKKLTVQHDPVPWRGEINLDLDQVEQFYSVEKVTHGSESSSTNYKLCALLQGGRKIDIMTDLDSPDIPLFIEQQVEGWLHIEDRVVGGEIPRLAY